MKDGKINLLRLKRYSVFQRCIKLYRLPLEISLKALDSVSAFSSISGGNDKSEAFKCWS